MITGNVLDKFESIEDYWSPIVIADVNDQYVKLAKLKGEFVWHEHENEDEMFYVVRGILNIDFEDSSVTLGEGDFYVVKKGIRHFPHTEDECLVMLIEKKETKHTGGVISELTREIEEQL